MNLRSFRTLAVCVIALSIVVPCRVAAADAITLTWNPSTDEIAGYKLYVGTQPGTYSQNFDVATATMYTFTKAVAGQRYCFAVAAYRSSSIEGPKSNEVCGFSNAPPLLTNPGNRSSTAGQPTSLQLTGSDPEGQALTYGATGLPPGLSLMASTGYISGSGITAGNYSVRVTAFDGVLTSSQSFTWVMGSTTSPPSVTVSVQAIDRSIRDQVRLAWTTASWTEVWVYRNGALITQTANDGAFTDTIRRASGAYTYVVCAPRAATCSNNVTVLF